MDFLHDALLESNPLYLFFFICISLPVQKSVWVFTAMEMRTSYRCVRMDREGGVTDMALGECTSVWDGRCCVSVCCALICALGLMRYRCRSVRFNTGEGEMEKDGERRERWRWTKGRELASVRGREVEAEWKHIQSRLYKKSTQRTAGSNIHIYRYNRLAGLVRRRLDYLKCVIQSLVQRLLKTHCLYP